MKRIHLLQVAALALLAACSEGSTAPTAPADSPSFRITTTTVCDKQPGPTDDEITSSKNPANKEPAGQNKDSGTFETDAGSDQCHSNGKN